MNFRFPKGQVLKGSKNFEHVFENADKKLRPTLVVFISKYQCATKLGCIVSKKVSPKANKRNYLRRLLRDIFRNIPIHLREKLQREIVVIMRKNALSSNREKLKNDFLSVLDIKELNGYKVS